MKRTLLAMVATLGMFGCGDPAPTPSPVGGSNQMQMNPATNSFTCRASTKPTRVEYEVNGSTVKLTDPTTGQSASMAQVSSSHGARTLYGVWAVPVELDAASRALGLTLQATMQISATEVTVTSVCGLKGKTATATATSSAQVTDTELSILEAKEDVKTIKY